MSHRAPITVLAPQARYTGRAVHVPVMAHRHDLPTIEEGSHDSADAQAQSNDEVVDVQGVRQRHDTTIQMIHMAVNCACGHQFNDEVVVVQQRTSFTVQTAQKRTCDHAETGADHPEESRALL